MHSFVFVLPKTYAMMDRRTTFRSPSESLYPQECVLKSPAISARQKEKKPDAMGRGGGAAGGQNLDKCFQKVINDYTEPCWSICCNAVKSFNKFGRSNDVRDLTHSSVATSCRSLSQYFRTSQL